MLLAKRSVAKRSMRTGKQGTGGATVQAHWVPCLIWINKPLQPDFDATEDRQTDKGNEQGLNSI